MGEQQDGEGGPEVVEDRAADEVRPPRHAPGRLEMTMTDCVVPAIPCVNGGSTTQAGRRLRRSKPLDTIDLRIVGELQADGPYERPSWAAGSSLSAPAVADRVQRLERDRRDHRLPRGGRPAGARLPAPVIVRVQPPPYGRSRASPRSPSTIPEVVECHRVTGEDCFVLKLCLRAIGDLEGILDLFTPFGRTTTSVVQSSPVPRRPLPLE